MKTLRFVTKNPKKAQEVEKILNVPGLEVRSVPIEINEIQTRDVEALVRDKALKAFERIRRPLIVEHTGLYIDELNGFPGGLTQVFWDSLEADKFAALIGNLDNPTLRAETIIGYCDGKRMRFFRGSINGRVPTVPTGNRDFQWDPVFIPEGYDQTFAEMGDKKNEISMRRKAFDELGVFLKRER